MAALDRSCCPSRFRVDGDIALKGGDAFNLHGSGRGNEYQHTKQRGRSQCVKWGLRRTVDTFRPYVLQALLAQVVTTLRNTR